jgi:PKD domain
MIVPVSTIALRAVPMRRTLVCLIAAGAFMAGGLPVAAASAAPAWLAPVNLAEEEHEDSFGPYVGMDGQGDALAVWGGGSDTNETFRPAGGSWQAPGSLAGEDRGVGDPCVAVSTQGEAVGLWAAGFTKGALVIQAALKPSGGSWQAPVVVAEAHEDVIRFSGCHVAIDSRGDAQAVWIGNGFIIQSVYKPAGQDWQEPASVTEVESLSEKGHSAIDPQVAFDSQGDALAEWTIAGPYGAATEESVIQASSKPAGGMWQTPADLSAPGQEAYVPQLAMDSQGDALALWDLHSGEHRTVQVAMRLAGSAWQQAADLSEPDENAYHPELVMDAQGDAVAAWEVERGRDWTVQSVVRPAGEGWRAPVSVSQITEHGELLPQVAIDSQGDALAAWELYNGTNYLIQAAGYQAARPQLGGLVIPSTGTAGQPVDFSVSSLEVWAALGATRWSFGDGGSATGTSVTHTYAAAGAYQVTLTGEDVLGNTSSAAGAIAISSAPPTSTPAPTPTPAPTFAPPTITAAGQSASVWREGSRLASLARKQKLPVGTIFSFALDERASVGFAFTQQVGGRRVNGKCVAQTKKRRHKPACKRTVTAGTLSFTGRAGTNKVSFQGRVSSAKRLEPGKYALVMTATNAAGQRSNASSLRFTIVK